MKIFIKKIIDWFLYGLLGKNKLSLHEKETIKRIKAKEEKPETFFTKFKFRELSWREIKISKKCKLPKKYWIKGKSKFLHIRLRKEHKNNINQLKINKNYV